MWSPLLISMAALLARNTCPDLFIPSVLTPNCDGVNCEILKIKTSCEFSEFMFVMVDRWGNEKLRTTDPAFKLDSSEKLENGEFLPDGTYYYILKARKNDARKSFTLTGPITIITS